MARKTIARKVRAGWGAMFLNPQWDVKKSDTNVLGKWIKTGTHLSRYLAEKYVTDNFPHIPKSSIKLYGIRLSAEVFDPETLAYLSRANARGFGSEK